MKHYEFKVILGACGDTPEEAWADAVEGFCQDPGYFEEEDIVCAEEMKEE